jgi:hypothetical protein
MILFFNPLIFGRKKYNLEFGHEINKIRQKIVLIRNRTQIGDIYESCPLLKKKKERKKK